MIWLLVVAGLLSTAVIVLGAWLILGLVFDEHIK